MDPIRNSRRAGSTIGSAATAWCTRSRSTTVACRYRNRWARTIKWKTEHEAHKALFAAFNPMDSDPSVQGMQTDGIANTNIVWHAGKLLALEEAHAPFEMDPQTLESIGAVDVRRQTRRTDDRASEDRSGDRRNGLLRLQRDRR